MIFPFVLKGVVYSFIIIKVCFIGRFSMKLENYFLEIENHVLIKGALEKNCEVFNCCVGHTYHIEVLRLIKWILSKKMLHSVTNYY